MPSTAEISHHIHSISQTRQITNAMYLISSAKMRKSIRRSETDNIYLDNVRKALRYVLSHSQEVQHPFLNRPQGSRAAYIVIAADKGLAGGYNENVLNKAFAHMQHRDETYVFTVGQVGREFFTRHGRSVDVEFLHCMQDPSLHHARRITSEICDLFARDFLDEVFVVFTQMHSTTVQVPTIMRLLPLRESDFQDVHANDDDTLHSLLYEPNPKAVLDSLVPQYLVGLFYSAMVQSFASEQCARMTAMQSATENADEMLTQLRLDMNYARQGAITQELSEIISGML